MLTAKQWAEHVSYDPNTGVLMYKKTGRVARALAGRFRNYIGIAVRVDGRVEQMRGHRLAVLLADGVLTQAPLDHINGNTTDNRRCNLRYTCTSTNAANQKMHVGNRAGFKGVTRRASGRWQAVIAHHGEQYYLGLFDTPHQAARAYDAAAIEHFGPFARTNVMLGLLPPLTQESHVVERELEPA